MVIPVYNEAESILPLIDEVDAALGTRLNYEIIVVDDGSQDDTPMRLLQSASARLRVLQHASRAGQSAALKSGAQAAKGEWIATLDGDGQNDPADIWSLFQEVKANPRLWLLAGWRKQRRDSPLKKLSSRLANAVRQALLKDSTPDTGCGLKLIRREVFQALPYFDHMHRFLPALVLRAGGEVKSVPVNHRPRRQGKSKYGVWNRLWVGIVDVLGVSWLQRRMTNTSVREVSGNQRRED